MDQKLLSETAKLLVTPGKGILAADESLGTIGKRFEKIGVENTEENRRKWREILFSAQGLEKFISGVILFDETVWAKGEDSEFLRDLLVEREMLIGVKVDEGKDPAPESELEFLTKGLDRLSERLEKYRACGARFSKWRSVSVIGKGLPTQSVTEKNSKRLAEFARLSQENGLVPVVEAETLMDGEHDISLCEDVMIKVLTSVFSELERKQIYLPGILLKVNFAVPGRSGPRAETEEVAKRTLRVLRKCVPEEVAGIVFLSGGLSAQDATTYLNAVNKLGSTCLWKLSFSFGRALQGPALLAWRGEDENKYEAQAALLERARLNSLARYGEYEEEMEK